MGSLQDVQATLEYKQLRKELQQEREQLADVQLRLRGYIFSLKFKILSLLFFIFSCLLKFSSSSTFIDLLLIIDTWSDFISLYYRGAEIEQKVPGGVEFSTDEQGQSKFEI